MRKRIFAQIGLIIIPVASMLLTMTNTISMAKQKAITKEVAFYTDFTGPFPDTGRDNKIAGELWKHWINDERGGIRGVKVECTYHDTKYRAPQGLAERLPLTCRVLQPDGDGTPLVITRAPIDSVRHAEAGPIALAAVCPPVDRVVKKHRREDLQ